MDYSAKPAATAKNIYMDERWIFSVFNIAGSTC